MGVRANFFSRNGSKINMINGKTINSVRNLQILYFSKKIKKLKRFKKKKKKSALEPLLSYTTPIL